MSSSYSFRRNVLRWCKLLLGQLLNIGLSLTWVTAVSAEESNVIHEAVSPAVREFEINGTKLYVPLGWLIQISGERGRSDQTNQYLKPGEPVPQQFGSPAKLEYMMMTFCQPVEVPEPNTPAGRERKFSLSRAFVADQIPEDWCIGRVILTYGLKDLSSQPQLGSKFFTDDFIAQHYGPENQWGFRRWPGNDPRGPFSQGGYLGVLPTDVARDGGPVMIGVGRTLGDSKFVELGSEHLAIEGVRVKDFRWYAASIDPSQVRLFYKRSQAVLDWLATSPSDRPKKVIVQE